MLFVYKSFGKKKKEEEDEEFRLELSFLLKTESAVRSKEVT